MLQLPHSCDLIFKKIASFLKVTLLNVLFTHLSVPLHLILWVQVIPWSLKLKRVVKYSPLDSDQKSFKAFTL